MVSKNGSKAAVTLAASFVFPTFGSTSSLPLSLYLDFCFLLYVEDGIAPLPPAPPRPLMDLEEVAAFLLPLPFLDGVSASKSGKTDLK
jgi:hypothetical protein